MANQNDNAPAVEAPAPTPAFATVAAPANAPTINPIVVDTMDGWPHYSIRNGAPSTVVPYLHKSTIANVYKWVTIPGVLNDQALRSVDAFIRAHLYHINNNAPQDMNMASRRRNAIILGVARCVMLANYDLGTADLVVGESIQGPLQITYTPVPNAPPAITYTVLLQALPAPPAAVGGQEPPVDPNANERVSRALLTGDLDLTEEERAVMAVVAKCAQAIIPLQGFSLINDGHHYLSTPSKAGFRAFEAVEKQIWQPQNVKAYLEADKDATRDLLWHKAGHPVTPNLKMQLATRSEVATNLGKAGLGSAATRLPALETELKPIQTYLRLSDAVKAAVEAYSGVVENGAFYDVVEALKLFPIGVEQILGPNNQPATFVFGPYPESGQTEGVTVTNREEVKAYAEGLISRNQYKMAQAFGFYCKLTEEESMMAAAGQVDTLKKAYSLSKLRDACRSGYNQGYEMGGDYKAWRAKARADGMFLPPMLRFF